MIRRIGCALLALISLTVGTSCAAAESTNSVIAESGWTAEPLIEGTESQIGEISPPSCDDLFTLLDAADTDTVEGGGSGYANARTGSYLLLKERRSPEGNERIEVRLANAVEACPEMVMEYDSASVTWHMSHAGAVSDTAVYAMRVVDDGNETIGQLLISAVTNGDVDRVVRIIAGSDGVQESDWAAMDRALTSSD